MDIQNKEVRYLNHPVEVRANEEGQESRTITGYAMIFESESLDMGFTEVIRRGAITEELINNSDVIACWMHNAQWLLARSVNGEGTLKLELDDTGLKYTFEAPNTSTGNDVLELIKRGDVKGSSFAFAVAPEGDEWVDRGDGNYIRYINHIAGLYDVSPVVNPAYEGTSVSARSLEQLENLKAQKAKEDQERRDQEEADRIKALNEKHDNLLAEIDKW